MVGIFVLIGLNEVAEASCDGLILSKNPERIVATWIRPLVCSEKGMTTSGNSKVWYGGSVV